MTVILWYSKVILREIYRGSQGQGRNRAVNLLIGDSHTNYCGSVDPTAIENYGSDMEDLSSH